MIKCLKKYPYISNDILRKLKKFNNYKFKNLKIYNKSLTLYFKFKHYKLFFYNGKIYIPININYKKIGLKSGYFIKTKN
uniref:30S ribosomal protein S19 n=1 Tax=Nephromyces sp. ex Molgula occidentalis TaxID=2544991 RepID=A0A5C1H8C3_9APIC|nr:30S ribosomal protein S19 [Nephromyces sp. ex Molgula occidentalis]